MNSSDLLRRAASIVCGPGAYSRHAPGSPYVPTTRTFTATGLLERASSRLRSGAMFCGRGDPSVLAEAKARVCLVVGFPHVDAWEAERRPDWQEVRRVMGAA